MNVQSVQQNLGNLWTGLAARVHLPAQLKDLHLSDLHLKDLRDFHLGQKLHDLHLGDRLRSGKLRVPGFRFAETMAGTAYLNGERREMVFHLTAEQPDPFEYLRSGRTHIAGDVTIEGLAREAPLMGELWIHLFGRQIRYEFTFRDSEHRLLTFTGQKDLELFHPVHTLKNLPGHIRDEHGHEVGKVKLHFRTKDLPAFLRSFRPIF